MDRARPIPRARTGPVTGALERPSQLSPENRKADDHRTIYDDRRAARAALRHAHAAERQLQLAAHIAERHRHLATLLADAHQGRAVILAMIDARFAGRRYLLSLITDTHARAAAEQQLSLEQRAEHDQLAAQHRYAVRSLRRATLQPLALQHRGERRALGMRQRHQRALLAVILQQLRPIPLRDHETLLSRRVHITRDFLHSKRRAT